MGRTIGRILTILRASETSNTYFDIMNFMIYLNVPINVTRLDKVNRVRRRVLEREQRRKHVILVH